MAHFINSKNFLDLTCNVFVKDTKGVYRECNIAQAESFGAANVNDVIGKSDLQLHPIKKDCELCAINDLEVIKTGVSKIFIEPVTFVNRPTINMISHKIPYYNKSGKIIGVFGTSIALQEMSPTFFADNFSLSIMEKFHLPKIKITKREKECLEYLAMGMTAKKIGRKLGLSPRTIEFYIENMKKKLDCSNRIQLIAKINMLDI